MDERHLSQLEFSYGIASVLESDVFQTKECLDSWLYWSKDAIFNTVVPFGNILRNTVLVISHIKLPGYNCMFAI